MKNILIIGSNGMLGHRLVEHFKNNENYKIFTTNHLQLNIENRSCVEYFIEELEKENKIDYAINCAAFTDTTECENGNPKSYFSNVIGPKNLAEVCLKNKIKLIHISTDYVFSEFSFLDKNKMIEHPVNIYGLHKLLGEKIIENVFSQKRKNLMIIRTSWLYDKDRLEKTFIGKFLDNCKKVIDNRTKEVKVTVDNYGKPTSCQMLSEIIERAIENEAYGIFDGEYVGKTISRYEFAEKILKIYNDKNNNELLGVSLVKSYANEFQSKVNHPINIVSAIEGTMSGYEFKKEIHGKIFEGIDENRSFEEMKENIR